MMTAIKQQSTTLLSELLEGVVNVAPESDQEIVSVQTDSRKLKQNDVFIAMPGDGRHGLEFLDDAVKSGACCVLYDLADAEKFKDALAIYKEDILIYAVASVRDVAGVVIDRFYHSPGKQFQIVAVTGTDGKTSVSRFIAQAMSNEMKTALIGTTGNGVWGKLKTATHTTPDVLSLHKMLFELKNQHAAFLAMEVSSHGIEQQRIAGVDINTAVLTNVTRDHLDYHGTVEKYQAIKKQLFSQSSVENVVLNIDDAVGIELANELQNKKNIWAYSLETKTSLSVSQINVSSIAADQSGFVVKVNTPQGVADLRVPLLGRFNISNVLAVLAVLLINKVALNKAIEYISRLETVPGRMEVFHAENKATAVVDYAHTPKALELALKALREHFTGKIWCVFGCGGDRDQGKRPLMGAVAENVSDAVVITDDNPRNENSDVIIEQILAGMKQPEKAKVITDRQQAIEYACEHAAVNDVVLVAGKGHEEYQIVGDDKKLFSDRVVVSKIIGGMQ